MKKPTPDEVYEAFIEAREEYKKEFPNSTSLSTSLCELYRKLKPKFRGYKSYEFQLMQEEMYDNWQDWNGYMITLMRGHLSGVCTKYKRDRDTIHPSGWKFIIMRKVD